MNNLTINSNGKAKELIKENTEINISEQIRKYFLIIYENKFLLISIILACTLIAYFYAKSLDNVYEAAVSMKIEKPKGNILENLTVGDEGKGMPGHIVNQIALMQSYYVRDFVTNVIRDSLNASNKFQKISLLSTTNNNGDTVIMNDNLIRKKLLDIVNFENPKGLDVINIIVRGPDFKENAFIAGCYAEGYLKYNLQRSRAELTELRKFLEEEKRKKFEELNLAEANLENFQKISGMLNVESNVQRLINTSSTLEALKNSTDIEIRSNEASLNILKDKLSSIDPDLNEYIDYKLNESFFNELSKKIAEIEINRDLELANITDDLVRNKITKESDDKINALKSSYDEQLNVFRSGLEAVTPSDKKDLVNSVFDKNVNLTALRTKLNSVKNIERSYVPEFKKLPAIVIEYAKLERNRKAAENLYTTLESRYQEAIINERSSLGNLFIMDPGLENNGPTGPKRPAIVITGMLIGLFISLGYIFGKNFLDRAINTPEDLESEGISVLTWIPSVDALAMKHESTTELIIKNSPKSAFAESFKALRTRVQFAKIEQGQLRTILVTSSLPSEGKTIVSANLAGAFALTGKKVLIMDCDLRKPRVHAIFGAERFPGLTDHLFNNVSLEDIIRPTGMENLSYITSGTLPPNPSELLGSLQMKKFLDTLKEKFDLIVIDSPPSVSVTDAEILFTITDGTILVCHAAKTDKQIYVKTYKKLYSMNSHNLLGCVLNNFKYKSSYGYYYNYYYYYSAPDDKRKKPQSSIKS